MTDEQTVSMIANSPWERMAAEAARSEHQMARSEYLAAEIDYYINPSIETVVRYQCAFAWLERAERRVREFV